MAKTYPVQMEGARICKRCNVERPIVEYRINQACAEGRLGICKHCQRESRATRRDAVPDLPDQSTPPRICRKCNEEKPLTEFNKNPDCALGRAWRCKRCEADHGRVWRATEAGKASNRRSHLAYERTGRARDLRKVRRDTLREWLRDHKRSHGCALCPEREPVCLDFHHLGGHKSKLRSVSAMLGNSNLASVRDEIAKCVILCANCHRKVHEGILCLPLNVVATRGPVS